MNEPTQFIEGLIKRIIALDPAMLVFVFCIALGYILKSLPKFPNERIPYVCMGLPPVFYPLMVWNGFDVRKIASDIALAIIFAALAWGAHKLVLKRLVDAKVFPPDEPETNAPKPNENQTP